jgi:hypothetical protein
MRGLGEGVRGFKEGMSGAQASSTAPPPPAAAPVEKPAEDKKA